MFISVDTTYLAQGPRIACFACLTSRTSRQCGGVGPNSFLSWEFKGPVGGVPLNCHDIGDVHNDRNPFQWIYWDVPRLSQMVWNCKISIRNLYTCFLGHPSINHPYCWVSDHPLPPLRQRSYPQIEGSDVLGPQRSDWHLLGCKLNSDAATVWINKIWTPNTWLSRGGTLEFDECQHWCFSLPPRLCSVGRWCHCPSRN